MPGAARDAERVLVVGAGPVGLLLAACLGQRDVPTLLIERRERRARGSRAIGIHPPGVEALDRAGVLAPVRDRAVRLTAARATGHDGPIALLDLTRAGEVLTVPQDAVEDALEERVAALPAVEVRRGCELVGLEGHAAGVEVALEGSAGAERLAVGIVVGCDGRSSAVRRALGVAARGGPYRDRYAMADLPRDDAGSTAEIVLHRDGVVESFPLLGARRWVVRLEARGTGGAEAAGPDPLAAVVAAVGARLGVDLGGAAAAATFASAFGVERLLADRFAVGRVALAGDAAHVVSPIGGQGMNLGWIDALDLADRLASAPTDPAAALRAFEARRRPAARRAIRRAALNMHLGRPASRVGAAVRDALLRRARRPPFAAVALAAFTMRGLT